jgi:metal-dependent hydrolase (beta-lactamase superfamily II)
MTAVEWLIDQMKKHYDEFGGLKYSEYWNEEIKQALEMEKQQIEKMYSEEEVIAIVEKSRKTSLTAEYLLLTEQFKKNKL